ncbi:hypothetical protein MNEG_10711, partial [Monoraphidium neglectum]
MPTNAAIARREENEQRKASELHSQRDAPNKVTNHTATRGDEAAAAREDGQQRLSPATNVAPQAGNEGAAAAVGRAPTQQ